MSKLVTIFLVALLLVTGATPLLTFGADKLIPGIVQDYVYVYRDNWGVPHIYASNMVDACFAWGYMMAEDRLYEMDLFRRTTAGRVAEIMGPSAFSQDVLMRTLGIWQIANDTWYGKYSETVPPEVRAYLQSFSNGVNRYVADMQIPLDVPTEYRILSYKTGIPLGYFIPYAWTPQDSIAIAGLMGLQLTDTSKAEIIKGALTGMLEPYLKSLTNMTGWSDFLMPVTETNSITIEMPDPQLTDLGEIKAVTAPLQELLGVFSDGLAGSNNWVIDDLNTTSGYAMLANDPHLALQAPGINWQVHVNVPGVTNTIGCCIPGGMAIYTGHNDYFAFGVTNLMADIMDLYYYVKNETHYWYVDHWEPFIVTPTTIRTFVTPTTINIVSTRHGPLITTPLPAPYNNMSLRWGGRESGYGEVTGFSLLLNATNKAEWQQALSHMCVIIQNYVYADKNGNIAWCPSGKIPVREPPPPFGTGTLGVAPSNGSAGQNEWFGWIPHSSSPAIVPLSPIPLPVSLPYVENPPEGFIATSNNQPINGSWMGNPAGLVPWGWPVSPYPWPVWIGPAYGFDPGYREQRIVELIKQLAPIDIDDMKTIQADSVCIPARNMMLIILGSMGFPTGNATIDQALGILATWNYTELRGLVAPLIWEAFLEKFTYNTFYDELGPSGLYPFPNTILPLWKMVREMAFGTPYTLSWNISAFLFDNKFTPSPGPGYPGWEIMPQIINQSLHDAVNWIASQLGTDMSKWQYGKLHVTSFAHPMGASLPTWNVPAVPAGCDGGPYTVDPGGHNHKLIPPADFLFVSSGSSYRGIYECKNPGWSTSLILVPPGESGRITGPPSFPYLNVHYGDTFQMWLNNQYTPCLFDDTTIQTYPRTVFYPAIHNIAIIALTPSSTRVIVGTTIQVDVTVKNEGITNETFTVTLKYDGNAIGVPQTVTDLVPMATKLLTFSWDTTGVTPNEYTLTAEASTVPGEVYFDDNIRTAIVRVGIPPTLKVEPPILNAQMINKTVSVDVTINDLGQYWKATSIQFRLCFDNTLLEFINATEGPFMADPAWNLHGTFFVYVLMSNPPYGPNVDVGILLLPDNTGNWNAFPSGSGVLATITFKTISQEKGIEKPPLTCSLTLANTEILDEGEGEIPHNLEHGEYRMYPTQLGDLNEDYTVDMKDIRRVAKAFGSYPGHERWDPVCDLYKDDLIDMRDVRVVAKYFGWTPTYDP